jgi:succinyl-CoA synthetase beta subunit
VLRAAGVPYLQGLREALKAIKALIAYHLEPPHPQPQRRVADAERRAAARALIAARGPVLTEDNAKRLIASYGLPVVAEALAADAAAAVSAATRLGYPVAVKVVSPDIAHKAAIGGVRLGLTDAAAVANAYRGIMAAVSARQPEARIAGVLVQPMVDGAIEVIMGLKRDPQFGMTILFGLGGVFTEALHQVAVRLAPIAEAEARAMVAAVPAVAAMIAARGGDRQAVETLVGLLLRLSELAVELEDDIEELDLNPLIVDAAAAQATVVDALIVARTHQSATAARGRQGE